MCLCQVRLIYRERETEEWALSATRNRYQTQDYDHERTEMLTLLKH